MKKTAILIIALLIVALLSGCNSQKSNDSSIDNNTSYTTTIDKSTSTPSDNATITSEVKEFVDYINNGEYLKAVECYNDKMYGNYKLESEAETEILKMLNNLNEGILNGKKTENDSKTVIFVIDYVLSNTSIKITEYDEIKENIDTSVASKAAFVAGAELEQLKNYVDAIGEYQKVVEKDSKYLEAQTAIDRCSTTLKKNVFSEAATLAENNQYIEAIAELKNILKTLPADTEVLAKITVYEKTYISSAINAATEAFVTPSEDYSKSLNIINGALQFYPDNEELLSKKEYYNSFAPVKLVSLSQYDKSGTYGPTFLTSEEDPLGNLHTDVFRTWSYMYEYAWVVYILDGNYNKLTFTVYGTLPSDNEVATVSIRDYSQGDYDHSTSLYINETITRGAFPYEVEIDVTGVKMIRIYVQYGIAVADAVLQKTV